MLVHEPNRPYESEVLARLIQYGKPFFLKVKDSIPKDAFTSICNKYIYELLKSFYANECDYSSSSLLNYCDTTGLQLLKNNFDERDLEDIYCLVNLTVSELISLRIDDRFSWKHLLRFLSSNEIDIERRENGFYSMEDALGLAFEQRARELSGETLRLSTGFKELDGVFKGFKPGKLYVIAAEPEMGKSLFVQQLALFLAKQNIPVGILSTEMTTQDVSVRLLSMVAHKSDFFELEQYEIEKSREYLSSLPILICDGQINEDDIPSMIEDLSVNHGAKLIIIDYLQNISGRYEANTKTDEINGVIQILSQTAKVQNIPILAISSLAIKNMQARKQRRPYLSDLKDTSQLAFDATAVFFLCDYEGQHDSYRRLILGKNRDGRRRKAEIGLFLNEETLRFEEVSMSAHKEELPPTDEKKNRDSILVKKIFGKDIR